MKRLSTTRRQPISVPLLMAAAAGTLTLVWLVFPSMGREMALVAEGQELSALRYIPAFLAGAVLFALEALR